MVIFQAFTQRPRPSRSRPNLGWTPGCEWMMDLIGGTLLVIGLCMISKWSGWDINANISKTTALVRLSRYATAKNVPS